MRQRTAVAIGGAVVATALAIVLLAVSVDRQLYAPGAYVLQQRLAGIDGGENPLVDRHVLGTLIWFSMRKAYSFIAFFFLGFLTSPIFRTREKRTGRAAVFVMAFSAVVEIVQRVSGSTETMESNVFDIACGLVAGWFGAQAWNVWSEPDERAPAPPPPDPDEIDPYHIDPYPLDRR